MRHVTEQYQKKVTSLPAQHASDVAHAHFNIHARGSLNIVRIQPHSAAVLRDIHRQIHNTEPV